MDKPRAASLAEFELLVLLAALRLGPEDAYTVSIADDIEQRTGRRVRRANAYTTIERLEAKRLVSTELGDPRPEPGGQPAFSLPSTRSTWRPRSSGRASRARASRGVMPCRITSSV